MPYQKRGYRKRVFRRGRRSYGDARKALVIARGLKRIMNVEYKFFDNTVSQTAQATAPTIVQISLIDVGDTASSRDGDSIKVVGIYLNYMWSIDASATQTQVRIMLVQDKQTNGAVYVNSNLLLDVTAVDNIISPYNLDNKYRFRVLYDRVHHLAANGIESVSVKKYITLNQIMRFGGVAGTIADIRSNSFSVMVMSTEATNTPLVNIITRIRYVDN